jgi:purine-binding chemotaxis protein CheW
MRPLPVRPIAGVPAFVQGLAVVRGTAIPVVDAAILFGAPEGPSRPTRFITIKTGNRRIALAVDAVVDLREIPSGVLSSLPPLLRDTHLDAIAAVGTLDAELLLMLRSSRLVSEEVWAAIGTNGTPA